MNCSLGGQEYKEHLQCYILLQNSPSFILLIYLL
jgi:hypothetical protein